MHYLSSIQKTLHLGADVSKQETIQELYNNIIWITDSTSSKVRYIIY